MLNWSPLKGENYLIRFKKKQRVAGLYSFFFTCLPYPFKWTGSDGAYYTKKLTLLNPRPPPPTPDRRAESLRPKLNSCCSLPEWCRGCLKPPRVVYMSPLKAKVFKSSWKRGQQSGLGGSAGVAWSTPPPGPRTQTWGIRPRIPKRSPATLRCAGLGLI